MIENEDIYDRRLNPNKAFKSGVARKKDTLGRIGHPLANIW